MTSRAQNPRTRGKPSTVRPNARPSKKNKPPKAARIKEREEPVRGKEVTVRDSSDEAQIVYGRMRIGGNITFNASSQDKAAYLVTGNDGDDNQLLWTAKASGDVGNDITIEFVIPPTDTSNIVVEVAGSAIKITIKRTGGFSATRLNDVIAAIAANGSANALVTVQKIRAATNGFITEDLNATPLAYGGGTALHWFVTLTGHEIDAIEKLYLDEREVTFGASPDPRWGTGIWDQRVFMAFQPGTESQPAQPDLRGQLPSYWGENHRQRGWSGAYLILIYEKNVFPEGEPATSFLIRGKKVYDPRNSGTAWSRNGALIIADFLMNSLWGYGVPQERIHLQTWIDAANACDVSGFEYFIDGVFDVGAREETLRQMEQAIAGEVVESNGMYYIYPGVWRASQLDLNENDLRGEVSMNTHVSLSDRFNCVRGSYVSPIDDYNITDFPPLKNNTYITEDGRELYLDLALNFVTDAGQAQRIAQVELEKVRQGITLNWPGKVSCYFARVGENVRVSYARFGFVNKYFRIEDLEFVVAQDGALGVDLILRETAPGVFDRDLDETTVDLAPNTELPDPFNSPEPTDVELSSGTSELFLRGDGTVWSRLKVSWSSNVDAYTVTDGGFEIQYKPSASGTWVGAAIVSGSTNFYHITDVQDLVQYDVRIRTLNSLGIKSDWVYVLNHTVLGKTEPPSYIGQHPNEGFNAAMTEYGFVFQWTDIPDLDRSEYEIHVGSSYESGVFVWRGKGTTARWEHKTSGTYQFWIKSIDTSGNYSVIATLAQVEVNGPGKATVSAVIEGENLVFRWSAEQGPFAIAGYRLSYGPEYANSTQIIDVQGNSFVHFVDWGGVRTFWVAAFDISGNFGLPGLFTVNILNPNPVINFNTRVAQQNVMLNWDDPTPSSLPVRKYYVYKGDTYAAAVFIGVADQGTFHPYVELFGGTFTYWVVSVDSAGNTSEERSAVARVEEPDNFFIKEDNNLLVQESPTLVNAVAVPREPERTQNDIYLPIETTVPVESLPTIINPIPSTGVESFQAWWDNNGWENLQQAVDQDYDAPFLAPTTTVPGRVSWLVDYEVTFSSSLIKFQYGVENLGDPITFTPSIRTSEDGITWTDYTGSAQVFAGAFRYAEYILDFQGSSDKAFGRINLARALISLERKTEFIELDCFAIYDGVGGTPFEFTKNFLDVEDIQATVWGTIPKYAIVNFEDDPNPNGGRVLLYDKDGNPVDGKVRLSITGAVNA